jgi:hypothetical protein
MIKSKIEARERALEMAIAHYNGIEGNRIIDAVETAKKFESYLVGDAELPETHSDTELVKAFLEVMNSELDKRCKPMPDYSEILKAGQKGNIGISSEVPCKLENE